MDLHYKPTSCHKDIRNLLFLWIKTTSKHRWSSQLSGRFGMNCVWLIVLSHPLTWGLVITYLENMYVVSCMCLAILKSEFLFCLCNFLADSPWCTSHSDLILSQLKKKKESFSFIFVERFLNCQEVLFFLWAFFFLMLQTLYFEYLRCLWFQKYFNIIPWN